MSLREVQKKLGPGTLLYRAPNPGVNDETAYRWQIHGIFWQISFNIEMTALRVTYRSSLRAKPFDDVTLNADSMKSIEARFGRPSEKRGPSEGEGEYVLYSYAYYCGPNLSYEIEFGTGRTCHVDMTLCLQEAAYPPLRVKHVTIRKRRPAD